MRILEGEQRKREAVEIVFQIFCPGERRPRRMLGDKIAQLRGEVRKCLVRYHAVFRAIQEIS